MTQTQVQTSRPKWATLTAFGFFAIGFGALLVTIGLFGADLFLVFGSGLAALGVALAAFGGYGYFIEVRR